MAVNFEGVNNTSDFVYWLLDRYDFVNRAIITEFSDPPDKPDFKAHRAYMAELRAKAEELLSTRESEAR